MGTSPSLVSAIQTKKKSNVIKRLINEYASLPKSVYNTAWYEIFKRKDLELLQLFVEQQAYDKDTILTLAFKIPDYNIIKYLIDSGATTSQIILNKGLVAMCECESYEGVMYMLKLGAYPKCGLDTCLERKNGQILYLLERFGLDLSAWIYLYLTIENFPILSFLLSIKRCIYEIAYFIFVNDLIEYQQILISINFNIYVNFEILSTLNYNSRELWNTMSKAANIKPLQIATVIPINLEQCEIVLFSILEQKNRELMSEVRWLFHQDYFQQFIKTSLHCEYFVRMFVN